MVIFVPLNFLAGIYGMNFDNMPELHSRSGYFILPGILLGIVVVLLFLRLLLIVSVLIIGSVSYARFDIPAPDPAYLNDDWATGTVQTQAEDSVNRDRPHLSRPVFSFHPLHRTGIVHDQTESTKQTTQSAGSPPRPPAFSRYPGSSYPESYSAQIYSRFSALPGWRFDADAHPE